MHARERVPSCSAGGSGDERGDDVCGVSVKADAGSVVAHGGAGVGMTGGFLDVAEWYARVERGGDERMSQRVGSDALIDPCSARDAAHDPAGGVTIQSAAVIAQQDWSFAAFPDREVDGAGG